MMTDIVAEIGDVPNKGERIILHDTLWNDKPLCQSIPGKYWSVKLAKWSYPVSWPAYAVIWDTFGDRLKLGDKLSAWTWGRKAKIDQVLALRDLMEPAQPYFPINDHDEKLYPFQIPGSDFLVMAREALLGDEMGSGKTFQTIAAMRRADMILEEFGGGAYPALIVCPNTLKRNWEREIRQWLPEANPFVIHGSADKRRKQIAEAAESPNAIIIMNIESMRLHSRLVQFGSTRLKRCVECDKEAGDPDLKVSSCEKHEKELNTIPFKLCVIDEAHRVKAADAAQSRAVKAVFHGPTVNYRWALTGTPIANHPGDLWSILNTIAPDNWPAKSAFIDRYAMTEFNAFGGMTIRGLKPEHREEFHALLAPHFRRMLKSQVLKSLPDKVFIRHDVEMSPKQAKAYKDIEKDLLTILDDGTVLVANGNLPGALRMLQFASAYCEVDQGETPEDPTTWKVTLTDTPKSSKIDEMMSIIEDTVTEDERGRIKRKPVVVAAEHRQLIDLASARLIEAGIPFGRVTGAESPDEREANVRAFQAGKLDVMLFTYAAGGVGINLTRADTMIRLQRSWSMIANNQGVDRVHRIGSEVHESITIIDLVTAGTIEETQIQRLYEKAERMEEIVRDREKLEAAGKSAAELDAEVARIETTTLMEG
jgi:SNF2 family DNA or RNA helicase